MDRKDRGVSPVDAAIWIQMNGIDRPGGARMRGYSLSEIDIEHIMQQDFTATCTDGDTVAFGDGVPHARFYGTMPRKIRRYAMDREVIALPFAIRSMTSTARADHAAEGSRLDPDRLLGRPGDLR